MSLLDFLPVEILILVFSHLDQHDLAAASRVNRTIHHFVEPLLYRTIVWEDRSTPWPHAFIKKNRKNKVFILISSLFKKPRRRAYMRHLTFIGPKDYFAWDHANPSRERELSFAKSCIRSLNRPLGAVSSFVSSDAWERYLDNGHVDAIFTVLLLLASNLESLTVDFEWTDTVTRPLSFIGTVLNIPSCLANLRSVDFRFQQQSEYMDQQKSTLDVLVLSSLFYLPRIESIQLSGLAGSPFKWHRQTPPQPEYLKTLSCWSSALNENNLSMWLSVAHNLRSLTYHIHIERLRGLAGRMEIDNLKPALESSRETLEDLTLYITYPSEEYEFEEFGQDHEDYVLNGVIGSLRGFEKLTSLTIPLKLLLGPDPKSAPILGDLLPRSLLQLYIVNDGFLYEERAWKVRDHNKLFADFAATYKDCVPNLRVIGSMLLRIYDREIDHLWQLRDEERKLGPAREACIRAGLDFVVQLEKRGNVKMSI